MWGRTGMLTQLRTLIVDLYLYSVQQSAQNTVIWAIYSIENTFLVPWQQSLSHNIYKYMEIELYHESIRRDGKQLINSDQISSNTTSY